MAAGRDLYEARLVHVPQGGHRHRMIVALQKGAEPTFQPVFATLRIQCSGRLPAQSLPVPILRVRLITGAGRIDFVYSDCPPQESSHFFLQGEKIVPEAITEGRNTAAVPHTRPGFVIGRAGKPPVVIDGATLYLHSARKHASDGVLAPPIDGRRVDHPLKEAMENIVNSD